MDTVELLDDLPGPVETNVDSDELPGPEEENQADDNLPEGTHLLKQQILSVLWLKNQPKLLANLETDPV